MSRPVKLRPALAAFAQLMERKLRANDHKTHWSRCRRDWLRDRLGDEVVELDEAEAGEAEYTAECVDVANFAMMLADNNERTRRRRARPLTTKQLQREES